MVEQIVKLHGGTNCKSYNHWSSIENGCVINMNIQSKFLFRHCCGSSHETRNTVRILAGF